MLKVYSPIKKEYVKSIIVVIENIQYCFPKSQIKISENGHFVIGIPEWLAISRGIRTDREVLETYNSTGKGKKQNLKLVMDKYKEEVKAKAQKDWNEAKQRNENNKKEKLKISN